MYLLCFACLQIEVGGSFFTAVLLGFTVLYIAAALVLVYFPRSALVPHKVTFCMASSKKALVPANVLCYIVIRKNLPLGVVDRWLNKKRVRRTPEQIAADIDGQISKLEENIRGLEEKKSRGVRGILTRRLPLCRKKAAKLAERKKRSAFP